MHHTFIFSKFQSIRILVHDNRSLLTLSSFMASDPVFLTVTKTPSPKYRIFGEMQAMIRKYRRIGQQITYISNVELVRIYLWINN